MKLSPTIQDNLLALMLYDQQGGALVRSMVPVDAYDDYYRDVARISIDYWAKYNKPPGEHTVDLFNDLLKVKRSAKEPLRKIKQTVEKLRKAVNRDYVLAQASLFCRWANINQSVGQVLDIIEKDQPTEQDIQQAENILFEAKKPATAFSDPGIDLAEPAQALRFLVQEEIQQFNTGVKVLDLAGIRPARKKLYTLMSDSGQGKSQHCAGIAREAAVANHAKVLLVTLEMSEDDYALRMMQTLFGFATRDEALRVVRFDRDEHGQVVGFKDREIKNKPNIRDKKAYKLLQHEIEMLRPNIRIKAFPTGSLTIPDFDSYLTSLEWQHNFCPDCVAKGSKVLTNRGLVKIENVRLSDKLWDGDNWVSHKGVICKGIRNVITYCGITATEDHQVYTDKGWRSLIDCKQLGLRIAQTEVEGKATRLGQNYLSESSSKKIKNGLHVLCESGMREVQKPKVDVLPKLEKWNRQGLSVLSSANQRSSDVNSQPSCGNERSLQQSKSRGVETLRGSRNPVSIQIEQSGGEILNGFGVVKQPELASGSDRQQRTLRAGQYSSFNKIAESSTHAQTKRHGFGSPVQNKASRSKIQRHDTVEIFEQRSDEFSDSGCKVLEKQKQVPVYDILDAGPLHRFTVSGVLAHNCVIVDYPDLMKYDASNERAEIASIYRQFRGMASKRNFAAVAVTQANRSGETAKVKTAQHTGHALEKYQISDYFVTYNQTEVERARGLARLFVSKGRNEADKFTVMISQVYGLGQFCVDSVRMPASAYTQMLNAEHVEE